MNELERLTEKDAMSLSLGFQELECNILLDTPLFPQKKVKG